MHKYFNVGFVSVDIFRTGERDMNLVLSLKSDGWELMTNINKY